MSEFTTISLTQNRTSIINTSDINLIVIYKWCAWFNKSSKSYYAKSNIGNHKVVSLHRFLLGVTDPKLHVDHINGNTLDNRRSNLRICTAAENTKNHTKPHPRNKSGFRGVCWSKDKLKWKAYITLSGKHKHLLYSHNLIEAAKAFDDAAIEYYQDFHGKLNFPKKERIYGF